MVLVMENDGSLIPSRSQSSFARNYNDGIGQASAADELAILGEIDADPDETQVATLSRPAPMPPQVFSLPSKPPPFATPVIPRCGARTFLCVIGSFFFAQTSKSKVHTDRTPSQAQEPSALVN